MIEIIEKLDEIEEIINNDKEFNELKQLKEKILNNNELINKIDKLKKIDKYNSDYINLKKEILKNADYKRYVFLEKDLYLFIKKINEKLNSIKEKSCCM